MRIAPRNTVHFGYEIWSRSDGPSIRSPDAFVTRGAALAAARRFIDDVDRRLGLGPSTQRRDGEGDVS